MLCTKWKTLTIQGKGFSSAYGIKEGYICNNNSNLGRGGYSSHSLKRELSCLYPELSLLPSEEELGNTQTSHLNAQKLKHGIIM